MNLAQLLPLRETLWYSASILVTYGNLRAYARKNYSRNPPYKTLLKCRAYSVPNLINDLSATTDSKGVHTK